MPPLESSHTSINSPAWHCPQHPCFLPPNLAHQTQAEALIFLLRAAVSMSAFRVVPGWTAPCQQATAEWPPSSLRHAGRQPPLLHGSVILHPRGAAAGREGVAHKPTAPNYPSSCGYCQSYIPGRKTQQSVQCVRGRPVSRASVEGTGALVLLLLAKDTKHRRNRLSAPFLN